MLVYLVADSRPLAYVVTLGQGYFTMVFARLHPLASAQPVINNEFHVDLEPELWDDDDLTQVLAEAGRRLDALHLLPAPFPLEDLLAPLDLAHVKRLFGIGGLSDGNLSVRKDAQRFWMSASGVDAIIRVHTWMDGVTATGSTMQGILERIESRPIPRVPMS